MCFLFSQNTHIFTLYCHSVIEQKPQNSDIFKRSSDEKSFLSQRKCYTKCVKKILGIIFSILEFFVKKHLCDHPQKAMYRFIRKEGCSIFNLSCHFDLFNKLFAILIYG